MRFAALLALLSVTAEAQRFSTRDCKRMASRTSRALPCDSAPLFQFAPLSGAGGFTTACAGVHVTGAGGEAITFTRASVGECYSTDGQTLTQVASGFERVMSGDATDPVLGLLVEAVATTNDALQARNLADAVWLKTNVTCTKTATGMRNDANGASTCTATLANGTVLQPIVRAATAAAFSIHIKRRTGSGTINVTRDNGTTWTAVTGIGATWKRIVPTADTPGCAGGNCIVVSQVAGSTLNPTVGIQIVTSGDAVDLDFAQEEVNTKSQSTSPIETAAAATTRAAEHATWSPPAALSVRPGCEAVTMVGSVTSAYQAGIESAVGGTDYTIVGWVAGAAKTETATPTVTLTPGGGASKDRVWYSHDGTNATACRNGTCTAATASSTSPTTATKTSFNFGSGNTTNDACMCVVKRIEIDPAPGKCRQL